MSEEYEINSSDQFHQVKELIKQYEDVRNEGLFLHD